MSKLTKKFVDSCHPAEKEKFFWDDELPGFGLRVFPSGKKSYLVQYRHNGDTRRLSIGLHGKFTSENARIRAMQIMGEIAYGKDPSAQRKQQRSDFTVSQLCDLYLQKGVAHKKASTLKTDAGRIERHIKKLLGTKKVLSVQSSDIDRFSNDITSGKTADTVKTGFRGLARVTGGSGAATRTLGLLGAIFAFGVSHKIVLVNPVRGVQRKPDRKLMRFLSEAELMKLSTALDKFANSRPKAVSAINLLILTGCRRSEILNLRWSDIDWKKNCFILPTSKTGLKVVPVGDEVIRYLQTLPRDMDNPFVLPASRGKGHYDGLQKDWQIIRGEAGFADVRIHDLRHTYASVAAEQGYSLLMIGKLLGHADPSTTQIYTHLTEAGLLKAATETSFRMGQLLKSGKKI
jgi:integrase